MEHIPLSILFGVLIFLILLSGFFSSSEIGMMSLNKYRLRHFANQGNRAAIRVQSLLKRPDRLLGVILIGNTFANILASAITTIIAVKLLGDIGIAIGTIVLTLVILIFAEVAPKTVAALFPEKIAYAVSPPLLALRWLFSPLVWFANGISNALLRLCGVNLNAPRAEHLSGEELRTVVYEAGGLIPDEHKNMLISILDLEKVTVDDIMVQRGDIVGIDLDEPWDDIIDRLENSQHTRLPVYRESIDSIIGIVHLRSVLNLMAEEKLTLDNIQQAAEECYFVPEGTPLHTQLLNFKAAKVRSALVVDEYGDIQGLVTLEDILEEIVGEFTTDFSAISKDIFPQEDGSFLVDGGTAVRDLNRNLDWKLPQDGPKTLSGLLIEHLEAIPTSGTSVLIADHPVEIIHVKDNKVKTAKIYPRLQHSDDG